MSLLRIVCFNKVEETKSHFLLAHTLDATMDSVFPTRGIPLIPTSLCPSCLNNSAKKID